MRSVFSKPFISAGQIDGAVNLESAIAGQRAVFSSFDNGVALMGNRRIISSDNGSQFAYIARASMDGPTIIKFGSITNANRGRDLPVVHSYIGSLHRETGALEYFFDGEAVTRIRTTAASMLAAQILTNNPLKIVVVGGGVQGRAHLKAVVDVFHPDELLLVSRGEVPQILRDSAPSRAANNLDEACQDADLIFLCTNSLEPVLTQPIKKGATVISIGSFAPNRSEVAADLLLGEALLFADDAETCKSQCGAIANALKEEKSLQVTSLGQVINHPKMGRQNREDTIFYFSVGLGIQDAALIEQVLRSYAK